MQRCYRKEQWRCSGSQGDGAPPAPQGTPVEPPGIKGTQFEKTLFKPFSPVCLSPLQFGGTEMTAPHLLP